MISCKDPHVSPTFILTGSCTERLTAFSRAARIMCATSRTCSECTWEKHPKNKIILYRYTLHYHIPHSLSQRMWIFITEHKELRWKTTKTIMTTTTAVTPLIRVQLKRDATRWHTGGEMKGKVANGVGSQYSSHYTGTWCIQHYYRWCAHLGCQ